MAAFKLVILAIFMVTMIGSLQAIELFGSEEGFVNSANGELIEGAKRVTSTGISGVEASKVDEELVKACANKFIKSCEEGRKCMQVICPSGSVQQVRY
jgi:hypothetical protein